MKTKKIVKSVKTVVYVGRELSDGKATGVAVGIKQLKKMTEKNVEGVVTHIYWDGVGSTFMCKKYAQRVLPFLPEAGEQVKFEVTIKSVKQ